MVNVETASQMASRPRNSTEVPSGSLRPVACVHCRRRRSYCSKERPTCSRCRDNKLVCVYEGARKILVNESYLRALERAAKSKTASSQSNSERADSVNTNTDNGRGEESKVRDEESKDRGEGSEEGEEGDEDDEEDKYFTGAEPLLQSITRLNLNKPSTTFQGPASSDTFLHNMSKATGLSDGAASLETNSHFYEPGTLPCKQRVIGLHVRLPPLHIARRFFSAQYSFIGPIFAFTDSKEEFERSLANGVPDPSDREACLAYAKLLIILAFGQLYSVNQWVDFSGPPGFAYFVEALSLLPETHEEGTLLCVETLALAGYFLQNMNRRDAAFQYIGRALRMAISLGLHHEVESIVGGGGNGGSALQAPILDEATIERRRRVWWSVYSLDRILSVKSGNPITIQDEDIGVQLPSRLPSEPEYCPAVVLRQYTKLSSILGEIHTKIYRKTNNAEAKSGKALMASVQKIILSLSDWDNELPYGLRFDPDHLSVGRESVSTLAHYYQCINMTVRPLLFHIVQKRLARIRGDHDHTVKETDWKTGLSQPTVKVMEMCIGAAHDSINIMAIASQKDLVATYGYMDGEHIFSATIVMVMVCAAFPTNATNLSSMNTGLGLLRGIAERGNSQIGARYELLSRLLSAVMPDQQPLDIGEKRPVFYETLTETPFPTPAFPAAGPRFPIIDIQGLAKPFYDESVNIGMDLGLWEEGFAYPTMDLDLDLAQQQPPPVYDSDPTNHNHNHTMPFL